MPDLRQSRNSQDPERGADKNEATKSSISKLLCSPTDLNRWVEQLSEDYNARLLWMLVVAQFVLKGFVYSYSLGGFDWLMAARNVPAPRMQVYSAVSRLPFAMKPLVGLLSDAFPIFGYQKNPYILISTIMGLAGLSLIAFSGVFDIAVQLLVLGLFCVVFLIATADVLTEAKYAERVRIVPERGPDLVTFVWLCVAVGGILATATLGGVLHYLKPFWVYVICLIPAAIVLVPTMKNYLDESKLNPEEIAELRSRYFSQRELVFLVMTVAIASLIMMVTGLLQESVWVNLAAGLSCAFFMMFAFLLLTSPIIGKMVIFGIIQHLCAFSTSGAVFYFYTDSPEMYPEGPHFSPLFYVSVVGLVGQVFSLMGFGFFNLCMKHWTYHSVFFATNLVCCLGNALAAIQYSRLNIKWGIPDEAFAIGFAMVVSVTNSMLFLPGIMLLTQLCPKEVEATMYALLAGSSNLGGQIGEAVGAAVLTSLGVTPKGVPGESHKFDNLWIAALISALLPIVTLVLLPCMIPNALQTERLMSETSTAVDGSPWRRFQAWRSGRAESSSPPDYGATNRVS